MTRKDIIDTERKTPAENVRTFLLMLCVGFTIVMTICLIFGTIFADESARQDIDYCWSILGACVIAAALQFVFFTPTLIRQLAYPIRLLLFGLCLYAVLATLAVTMSWFPTDMVSAWASFTITYLVMLAGATAFFSFKARREYRNLNEKLAEYHRENVQP